MTQPSPPQARQVGVAAERLPRWLAGFTERHGPTSWTLVGDEVTLTALDEARAWIEIPFAPLPGTTDPAGRPRSSGSSGSGGSSALDPDGLGAQLVEHVLRERRIGVLLVRRSGHAAGLFEGSRLVTSKVDSSYVQGTTKAGGWSQQRYARRRGNQTDAAFAHAADVVVRVLGGVRDLDALVVGGDKEGVRSVLADRRLAHLPAPSGPWLTVKDPKLKILEAMPEQFRSVRIRLDP